MSTTLPFSITKKHTFTDSGDDFVSQIHRRVAVDEPVKDDQLLFHIETMVTDIRKMIASSFGPCGMNKLIINPVGDVYMTSDGKTILKEIDVLHPAAVHLKRLGQSMDKACGDGTKLAVLLACSLIQNALPLLRKDVHPTIIIRGYELAMAKAYEMIEYVCEDADNEMILAAVKSAAFGKGIPEAQAEQLAENVIQTVIEMEKISGSSFLDLERNVKVLKKTGAPDILSYQGVILDEASAREDMPQYVEAAGILLLRNELKVESGYINPEHFVRLTDPNMVFEMKNARKNIASEYAQKIIESGANVVFCEGEIDSVIEEELARHKILAFKRLKIKDMEYISLATGAEFKKIQDESFEMADGLGYADSIQIIKKRYDTLTYIQVKDQPVMTILIHEPMKYGLGKIEEAANDALNNAALMIKNPYVVTGAGGTEYFLARSLKMYAHTFEGKEQLAVSAFADSFEEAVKSLAKNIGMDVTDAVISLSAQQSEGVDARLDIGRCVIGNSPVVYDCATVKKYALVAATETVTNILRVDEILLKK